MTATVKANGRGPAARPKAPPVVPKGQIGAPSRRPHPARWALAVVLVIVVAVAGLLNVSLVSTMSHRSSYLAMAHTVGAGQIITAADLQTVDLAGASNLNALAASQRSAVVGRAATVTLEAHSLVPAGAVGTPSGLPAGQSLVALGLKTGQYPPALRQGDHVMIVGTGSGSGLGGAAAGAVNDAAGMALVADSRVMAVGQAALGSGSDEVVVSVAVDGPSAARVAGAASVGKVSVVLLAGGQ